MRNKFRRAGLAISVAVLCSCAGSRGVVSQPDASEAAIKFKHALIGKPAEDLLRCAGVPVKTTRGEGQTLWQYAAAQKSVEGESQCAATVELVSGKVAGVVYRASAEGPADLCSRIFLPCFPNEKAQPENHAGNCPEGWESKNGEPCYPSRPVFGATTK